MTRGKKCDILVKPFRRGTAETVFENRTTTKKTRNLVKRTLNTKYKK